MTFENSQNKKAKVPGALQDRDLKKLVSAFGGLPQGVMRYHVLLFRRDRRITAARVRELPSILQFEGRDYRMIQESSADDFFGFWDGLRNKQGKLIGFCISVMGFLQIVESPFVRSSENVEVQEHCTLLINLTGEAFTIDILQAFPIRVYRDENGEFILGISQWGDSGEVGFEYELLSKGSPIKDESKGSSKGSKGAAIDNGDLGSHPHDPLNDGD